MHAAAEITKMASLTQRKKATRRTEDPRGRAVHKETTAKLPPFSEVVRSAFELRNALTSFTLEQHGLAVPSFRLHCMPGPPILFSTDDIHIL